MWAYGSIIVSYDRPDMEKNTLINPDIQGVSLRILWGMIICTIVACSTILGVYYNFRNSFDLERQKTELELKIINMRLDKLEGK